MATAPAAPIVFRPPVPARRWAVQQGKPISTVLQWCRDGEMDGRDAEHPRAAKDGRGVWQVWPDAYLRVVEVEPPRDEAQVRLIRTEIAAALREFAAALEQSTR